MQWKFTRSRSFGLLLALTGLHYLILNGDGRNDAAIVDYFIYFTVRGSACTVIIESAYLRDLEWQSTCSQHCVLMSASMVLRIQTPSGDGRNDAGIVDYFVYFTVQLVLLSSNLHICVIWSGNLLVHKIAF